MPDHSPNLSLPYLMPSQAQKHVTHNEALRLLDTLVQLAVQEIGATTPPAAPEDGALFALGTGATGAWAGQDGKLACFNDNSWTFLAPQDGWRAWDIQSATLRVHSAGDWLAVVPPLQNLDGLGVGTSSDSTNRLAVAAPAALFTHAGSDHRMTINKASAIDTASLVMQSNWSGRAEMGLTGDEDFHIRVSPDGSTWTSALTLNRDTGATQARCLVSGTVDIADDTVAYIPTPSAGGMVAVNLVHEDFPQAHHCGLFSYDAGPSLLLYTLVTGSGMKNLNEAVLTGTTGTDGDSSLAVRAGELQLENRYGGPRRYAYTFLNTY